MRDITSTSSAAFAKTPHFTGPNAKEGMPPPPLRTYSYGLISLQPPQTPPHLESYEVARLPSNDIYRIYEMYSPESYCIYGSGGRAALTGLGAGAIYLGLTGAAKDFLNNAKPLQALLTPLTKQAEPSVKTAAAHAPPLWRSALFMIPALSWSASVLADALGVRIRTAAKHHPDSPNVVLASQPASPGRRAAKSQPQKMAGLSAGRSFPPYNPYGRMPFIPVRVFK